MIDSCVSELAKACEGILLNAENDINVEEVVINDKEVKENCCYCAIKGERFDGCDFVPFAIEAGASVILTERKEWHEKYPLIVVNDVRSALLKAARYYRNKEIKKLYAVSGSVGKTTVKDMIHSILAVKRSVLKTPENKNNLLGAPLTVLSNHSADTAVIEAGISLPGEMDKLGELLCPDVAVITNIENMHTETMGDKTRIAQEKLRLLSYLKPRGRAVLLYDEPLLKDARVADSETVFVSAEDRNADFCLDGCVTNVKGTRFNVMYQGKVLYKDLFVPVIGKHNAVNALLAIAAVFGDATEEEIREGLSNIEMSKMRQKVLCVGGNKVFLDTYNAGPASCRAALSSFDTLCKSENGKRKIIVFGSMLELGAISKSEHYALGAATAELAPDALIVYGSEAKPIADAAVKSGMTAGKVFHFSDAQKRDAIDRLKAESAGGAVVLIKGSRGMRMEEFAEIWTNTEYTLNKRR